MGMRIIAAVLVACFLKMLWDTVVVVKNSFRAGDDCMTDYDAAIARKIGQETATALAAQQNGKREHEDR